jgi:hypothetical protein
MRGQRVRERQTRRASSDDQVISIKPTPHGGSFNHERPTAQRPPATGCGRHARYRDGDRGRPHLDAPQVGPRYAGREADPLLLDWRNTEESALAVALSNPRGLPGGFALLLLHHHEHVARVVEKPPMRGG